MIDSKDNNPPEEGAPTIREVMDAVRLAQEEEIRQQALEERNLKREALRKQAQERREQQRNELRERHARRESALKVANTQIQSHVSAAGREIRAALRDVSQVPLPRNSPQGREQLRIRRSLEEALAALGRVGRGTFHETEIDFDFES